MYVGVGMMTVRRHGAPACATPMISALLPTPGPNAASTSVSAEENALAASIVITTDDGREVCLDNEQQLTEEDKQVAFGRLQGLQNQMSRLMQRLLG